MDDNMDTKSILEELLLKRSQQKKKMSPNNYKERLFVLTKTNLSYYEYDKMKRGSRKGSIEIKKIRCVEKVNLEEQTPVERQYPFQIVYKDGLLYVYASNEESRSQWLKALQKDANLHIAVNEEKYRVPTFPDRVLKIPRAVPVLKMDVPSSSTTLAQYDNESMKNYGFQPPSSSTTVVQYDSNSKKIYGSQPNFNMQYIPKEDYPDWGQVRKLKSSSSSEDVASSNQKERNVNHTTTKISWGFPESSSSEEEENLDDYDWFAGNISRSQSEQLLRQKGKEGAFMVRNSSQVGMYTVSLFSKAVNDKKGTVKHYHVHTNAENKLYLAENYCFDSIPKLIHYHQHNSAGVLGRSHPPRSHLSKMPLNVHLALLGIWELKREEITLLKELGSGQFGVVQLGKWKGQYDVAVKMIKEGSMSEDEFFQEAQTMTLIVYEQVNELLSSFFIWATSWCGAGILMWEVFSLGKQPYDLYDNSQVVLKVSQGHRLYRPYLASDTIYQIMYSCWHELPEKRPTFQQLLSSIEPLREKDKP
ncbi:PREDICTED: cytoplasmic tyrosine-protein kinase BMX [Rhinopithecus bieti]|uniref:cytoplasmic tyrosine-protein kinase BMX n=1 Tax=Rhinopithecus bieti TaxID=61621 RepID=UPI00083C6383|nr:PREDICTED: cytoplasmic tyrosine-protein kinase BMX [Rhinopithecus bieti]